MCMHLRAVCLIKWVHSRLKRPYSPRAIMKAHLEFLNSNFGVLISSAVISGLIVQYITSSWQRRSWIFQQRYMAEKATFDKELDQKYKLLEDINMAVAAVLAYSRFVF